MADYTGHAPPLAHACRVCFDIQFPAAAAASLRTSPNMTGQPAYKATCKQHIIMMQPARLRKASLFWVQISRIYQVLPAKNNIRQHQAFSGKFFIWAPAAAGPMPLS